MGTTPSIPLPLFFPFTLQYVIDKSIEGLSQGGGGGGVGRLENRKPRGVFTMMMGYGCWVVRCAIRFVWFLFLLA